MWREREEDNKKKRHAVVCIMKLCGSFPPAIPSHPGTSSFSRPDYLNPDNQVVKSWMSRSGKVRLEGDLWKIMIQSSEASLSVYVCIYKHIDMYVSVSIYIHTHLYVYIYMYTYLYLYLYIYIYPPVCDILYKSVYVNVSWCCFCYCRFVIETNLQIVYGTHTWRFNNSSYEQMRQGHSSGVKFWR